MQLTLLESYHRYGVQQNRFLRLKIDFKVNIQYNPKK